MKVFIGDIVGAKDVFAKLIQLEFGAKTALKLMLITNEMQRYLESYEKTRISLVKKYGQEDEAGQIIVKAGTEEYGKFIDEINSISTEAVELNVPELTQDELTKDDSIKFSALDLLKIMPFLKKDDTI
jgi:hypothetical protein